MKELITDLSCIFTDIPGCNNIIFHEIKLDQEKPVRLKPYLIPFAKRECLENKVAKMIELDIIEPSNSHCCSPVLSLFLFFPLSGVRCCLQLFHCLICYSSPLSSVSCLLIPVSLLSCLLHISLYTFLPSQYWPPSSPPALLA